MWGILASFWMISHPWEGIRHDGILYAAQAMLHVRPEIFGKDLFFLYGSQDIYTVFGRIYSHATELLGLVTASRVLWGVSQLAWFFVAVAWIRHVFSPRHLLLAASVTFALPVYYSSDELLRLAESFLTARSFAEPLALGGLLAIILRRRLLGSLSLTAAAAVHPVMAAPAVAVAIAYLGSNWLRWNRSRYIVLAVSGIVVLVVVVSMMSRVDDGNRPANASCPTR